MATGLGLILAVMMSMLGLGSAMNYEEKRRGVYASIALILSLTSVFVAYLAGRA